MAHPLTPPLALLLRRLPRPAEQWVESIFRRLIRRWHFGGLKIRFPDGRQLIAGDPRATEWAIIDVHDRNFLIRVLVRGEMGAGESFVAGEWSSPRLVESLRLFLRNLEALEIENSLTQLARIPARLRHLSRINNRHNSESNIHAHYDLGNDFYRLFLGESWTYSCGYWRTGAKNLEQAQQAKADRLFEMLELDADDHLLEIGCGWGTLAIRAAQTRGCRVTAITVSRQQYELASERVANCGLTERVEIRYCDYRDVSGQFSKIVSVEMIEAVGYEFLDEFFLVCAERLVPGGRVALQSITIPDYKFDSYRHSIDWTQLYIFPGSLIPSIGAIASSSSKARLELERIDDIGVDYVPTLNEWRRRFKQSLAQVHEQGFDESFIRLWELYLSFSQAAFAEHSLSDVHILLCKPVLGAT